MDKRFYQTSTAQCARRIGRQKEKVTDLKRQGFLESWIFAAIFFALCLIPSVGMPFYKTQLAENRTLSAPPQIRMETGELNARYFEELQTYVAEHFAFRGELVEADSRIKYRMFGTPSNDQVVIGKDGWLFFDETLADYAGVTLSDSELDAMAGRIAEAAEYVRAQGKQPLLVIVPNKNSVYPEYMPRQFGDKAERRNLTELQDRFDALGVPYVDAYGLLVGNKGMDELYLHEDTHWNNTGARLVLNEIYKAYGLPARYSLAGYDIEEIHEPDLYKMLFPLEEYFEAQRVYHDEGTFEYARKMRSLDDITITTKSDYGTGSILVYRDSFGRAMIPYMGAAFQNAVFNRSTPYDLSLASRTECDYVLFEIGERNLRDLGQMEIPR